MVLRRPLGAAATAVAVLLVCSSCTSPAGGSDEADADIELITTTLDPDDPARPSTSAIGLPTTSRAPARSTTTTITTAARVESSSTSVEASSTTTDPNAGTTTTTTQLTTTSASSTSVAPTTVAGLTPWRVGLLNNETTSGATAFRKGLEAAVDWWNHTTLATSRRSITLESCSGTDEASTVACADSLASESDALIHGVDPLSELSIPVIEESGVPVLGGIALSPADAASPTAGLDIGGPPAVHAAVARLAADQGVATVAVFHDDTAIARDLVDAFTRPVLESAELSATYIEVPVGTADATGHVALVQAQPAELWLVLTSQGSCGPLATARRNFGITTRAVWSTSCAEPAVLDRYGNLMKGDLLAFELVVPTLFDFVNSDLRAGYELANQVLLQYDQDLVDDPMAMRGWLVGNRLTQTLDRGAEDLIASRNVRTPNPISAGTIDCAASATAVCSGDIMFFGWTGSEVELPMTLANGLVEQLPG